MMRVFQNYSLYSGHLDRINRLARAEQADTFVARRQVLDRDRCVAMHLLKPAMEHDPSNFHTCCNDEVLQRYWARENGMAANCTLDNILHAQIEAHRTEVFYNLDPMLYPSSFLRRLPASVRTSIAWRAAPSGRVDFTGYTLVVCNFPGILAEHQRRGCRTAYFFPSNDPAMADYASNDKRPIDVLFVGGFTRHHMRRIQLLSACARLAGEFSIAMNLESSRLTNLAESPLGRILPLGRYRRPAEIRRVARPGVFGTDLYQAVSSAKIVLNGAIDMAGSDRGNARCFESMGCGALLLSDAGVYPEGMVNGQTLVTYDSVADAMQRIREMIENAERRKHIAGAGRELMATQYSKDRQWQAFNALV